MSPKGKNKMHVYVPPGAKTNNENISESPPRTIYEKSKRVVDQEVVKKIVKGKYGREG